MADQDEAVLDSFLSDNSAPASSDIPPLLKRPDEQSVEPATPDDEALVDSFGKTSTSDDARQAIADDMAGKTNLDFHTLSDLYKTANTQGPWGKLGSAVSAIRDASFNAQKEALLHPVQAAEDAYHFVEPALSTAAGAIKDFTGIGQSPEERQATLQQPIGSNDVSAGSGLTSFAGRVLPAAGNLIGGVANLADPADASNVDAVTHIINRAAEQGITDKDAIVAHLGGDPGGDIAKAAEFGGWSLLPVGAESALSPLIAKGAEAAVEKGTQLAGKAAVGAAKVGASATPAAISLYEGSQHGLIPLLGSLVAGYGKWEGLPVIGGKLAQIKQAILQGPFDLLEKAGTIAAQAKDGQTVMESWADTVDKEINRKAQQLANLQTEFPNDAAKAMAPDAINGGRLNNPGDSTDLLPKGPAQTMRSLENDILGLNTKRSAIRRYQFVNQILSDTGKFGLRAAGNTAVGATTMAALSGTGAPPGQEAPAAVQGFETGAALAGPGALLHGNQGVSKIIRDRLIAGADNVLAAHPYAAENADAMSSLPQASQDYANKFSGLSTLNQGKPIMVLKPDDMKQALKTEEGVDVDQAPNGYAGKKVIYVNADTLAAGNVPHEMIHGTGLDSDPNVVGAVRDMMANHPDAAQGALDRYNKDLAYTAPDAKPLTMDSSPKEVIAALGADILKDIPPEALFGGRSGGQLISKWFSDKFGNKDVGTTSQYGFPVTPEMKSALTDALFDLGKKAEQGPKPKPPVAPVIPSVASPAAASIPSVPARGRGVSPAAAAEASKAMQAMGVPKEEAEARAQAAADEGLSDPSEIVVRAMQKRDHPEVINPIGVANEPKKSIPKVSVAEPTGGGVAGVVPEAKPSTAIPSVEKGQQADVVAHQDEQEQESDLSKIPAVSVAEPPAAGVSAKGPGEGAASVPSEEEIQGAIAAANQKAGPKMERAKGGKKQTVEERRAEIGREHRLEALQALLPNEGPGLHVVTDDFTGQKSYKGKVDFNNPLHKAFLNEFGYNAKQKANLKALQDNIGKGVYLRRYQSAGQEGFEEGGADLTAQGRREDYKASPTGKAGEGRDGPITEQDKAVTPLGIVQTKKGVVARVFDHGQFLGNLRAVIDAAHAAGVRTGYEGLTGEKLDHEVAADVRTVAYNHSIGHSGDGSRELHLLPDSEPVTREGKPQKVDPDRARVINMAFANESAKKPELPKPDKEGKVSEARQNQYLKAKDASEQALGLADLNKGYNNKGETNKLRDDLVKQGFDPGTLKPTVVSIRPDYIEGGVHPTPATEADRVHAHGFDIPANELTKEGLPRHDFSAGGFMPAKKGTPEIPERVGQDVDDFKGKAPRFDWDETDNYGKWTKTSVAKHLSVPADKFVYRAMVNLADLEAKRVEREDAKTTRDGKSEIDQQYLNDATDLLEKWTDENDKDPFKGYRPKFKEYKDYLTHDPEDGFDDSDVEYLAREMQARDEETSYPDDEVRTKSSQPFPPIVVTREASGKLVINDGNHRSDIWNDQGYDVAPAWVNDAKARSEHGSFMPASRDEEPSDVGRRAFAKGIPAVEQRGFKALRLRIPEVQKEEPVGVTETLAELNRRNGRAAELPTPENKGLGQGEFQMTPKGRPEPGPNADSEPWVHRYFELLKKEYPDGSLAPTGKLTDKEELEMDKLHQQAVKEFGSYDAFMKAHGQKSYGNFDEFHQANSATPPNKKRVGGDFMPAKGRAVDWDEPETDVTDNGVEYPVSMESKDGKFSIEGNFYDQEKPQDYTVTYAPNGVKETVDTFAQAKKLAAEWAEQAPLTKEERAARPKPRIESLSDAELQRAHAAMKEAKPFVSKRTGKTVETQEEIDAKRQKIENEIARRQSGRFMPARRSLIPGIQASRVTRIPALVGAQKRRDE